jgi:putative NIF3 family GTP cyclohydrolase 1 type 2
MEKMESIVEIFDCVMKYKSFQDDMLDILMQIDINATSTFNPEYFQKGTGLLLKHSNTCKGVLFAAFPSDDVFNYIDCKRITNSLLFIKHPMDWEELDRGFVPLSRNKINYLAKNTISLYCAHSPVDNCEFISPSRAFARKLEFSILDSICINDKEYGVICNTNYENYLSFRSKLLRATGLLGVQEGYSFNSVHKVAVVSGGGDDIRLLKIALREGCDSYITGILFFRGSEYARKNNPVFIEELRESNLNAFGCSHYLTEFDGIMKAPSFFRRFIPDINLFFVHETEKARNLKNNWGITI